MSEGETNNPVTDNSFYEQNAQCWRCQMYVPRVEMKYYSGMLYCPMCFQDVAEGGGRCQLCGRQLETGEQQLCRECAGKKRQKQKCPRCGSAMEEGMCQKCSRGEPPETQKRCPVCGSLLESGSCPKCLWGPGEGHSSASGSVLGCANCRLPAEPAAWINGQPYCPACAVKAKASAPVRVITKITETIRGLIRPKSETRVRVKAQGKKEEAKKEGELK